MNAWCVRRWKNLEDVQDRTRWASNDLSELQYECEQSRVIDWWRKRSTWYVVQLKITKNQKVKRIDRKLNQWTSLPTVEWKTQHIDIYQKQILNESRTSNRDVEKKQFVEKQIFWTQLLRFLQVLFSWILYIRHARLFDWDIRRTWRMKECVHWVIQMKCKNNDCTDVRFTMYRIQEKEKYYAIRTDNRQCRRKSDLYCEQFHLRHWLMRKIRAWLLKLILPRICNQMMTEENQAYW